MINKSYLAKANLLWGSLVHKIYPRCIVFNEDCAGEFEAHHLLSKGRVKCRRHCILCGVKICSYHHREDPDLAPHKSPDMFEAFMKERYPARWRWMELNKWADDPLDYKVAYERLLALEEMVKQGG